MQPHEFLVDRHKHRIVKRAGIWRMYCPERGTESIICCPRFSHVLAAVHTPCPHLDKRYATSTLLPATW
jgi:hypothetical protein